MYECWCWTQEGWIQGWDCGTSGKYIVFRTNTGETYYVEHEAQLHCGRTIPKHWADKPQHKWWRI